MAVASILFTDGRLKQIEVSKALAAYNALTGLTEPTEDQIDWLCHVKRIFLPPSSRPADYDAAYGYKEQGDDYAGVQQGMSQAIPAGDR